MPLLVLRDINLSFSTQPLFSQLNLQIHAGERLCILGRNGEGKSTLLKVIAGLQQPDSGVRQIKDGVKIARLQQAVPADSQVSVFTQVAKGLGKVGEVTAEYFALLESDPAAPKLAGLQEEVENLNGWQAKQEIDKLISQLNLPANTCFAELSGGMKRRVHLAQALVSQPDLLLLDEPTNHLDIKAIEDLEELVLNLKCALVFISHDRAFVQKLASRIVELDRGELLNWPGSYQDYLVNKQLALEAEAKEEARQDKKLAQEEAWARRGVRARLARNEGRVRALEKLRKERQARRQRQGTAQLSANLGELSGKQVIEVNNLSFNWPNKKVVNDFSCLITRGERIGLLGANGSGKTTLIKLLLGELEPQQGKVKLGSNLQVAYYDQQLSQLNPELSLLDNMAEGNEQVIVNGKPRHLVGYLSDFLFSPARMRQPVKVLSGGEKNRLMLAKLFAQPSNLLVMDEPTNDLDLETLDVLEELLANYQGTLLLISHDREFINNLATSLLVFEEEGKVTEYLGGYDDWLRQRPALKPAVTAKAKEEVVTKSSATKSKKLSYKDQREFDQLPFLIEDTEAEIASVTEVIQQPDFYELPQEKVQEQLDLLTSLEEKLETAYQRWAELEEMQEN